MRQFFHFSFRNAILFLFIFAFGCTGRQSDKPISELSEKRFANPPLETRPGALWTWLNGYVKPAQITKELEEMKAKGMRGAIIWDLGSLSDPKKIIPQGPAFLGKESLEAINHAIDEATRLGLELGLVASSSWNAGGSWVSPENGSKELRWSELKVQGPSLFSDTLTLPCKKSVNHFDVAVLAIPYSANKLIEKQSGSVDLTGKMNSQGKLEWNVPAGTWTILRFVCNNTGQNLMCPSPNSKGLMIDHLSEVAVENHLNYMMDQLKVGRKDFGSLKLLMFDSYELDEATDWTGKFAKEFRKENGYNPVSYLPALAGQIIETPEMTKRFLHDYTKTVSNVIINDHFKTAKELLNKNGLSLLAEGGHGGSARVDPLKAMGAADIPMGEFWNHMQFWVVKEAASAAHIYGKKFVNAESLTGWRHWQDGPFGYKRLFDVALCAGLNQVTFHTFAHNPPEAGLPGFAYHAGEHFNVNSTWWNYSKPMLDYMARCSYLLQQGKFVADVSLYYGDEAPNYVPSRRIDPGIQSKYDSTKCLHCGRPRPIEIASIGLGYDYDYVNEEVILSRMSVENGNIVLPDGMNYRVLALPDREAISLEVLNQIEKLVKAGATVIGRKPVRSVSLKDYPACDDRVRKLADAIWGNCNGETIKEHKYGKGRIIWNIPLREILTGMNILPDFTVENMPDKDQHIDYIHRRTDKEEIYFVSNSALNWEEVICKFRVDQHKIPFFWNADNGTVEKCKVFESGDGFIRIRLKMPPVGSVFVVFKESGMSDHITRIDKNSVGQPVNDPLVSAWEDIEILTDDKKGIQTRAWSAGSYTMTSEKGTISKIVVDTVPDKIAIETPWEIRFPEGWGAPSQISMNRLTDWTESKDQGVKYFSGTARYSNEFTIPDHLINRKFALFLDLGEVKEVAELRINGKELGILWKKPFRIDITDFVKAGENNIEIAIANLWNNRIVGDYCMNLDPGFTRTNVKRKFSAKTPLLSSGLLGPVVIYPALNVWSPKQ
jgi:hypothetical protein